MSQVEVSQQRKPGVAIRLGSLLSPGIREIRRQIDEFAQCWATHNDLTISGRARDDAAWVVLGDSLSQGIGASSFASTWPMQLHAKHLDGTPNRPAVALVNLSATGARIRDVVDQQLPLLGSLDLVPELITLTVGSNDLMRSARPRRAKTDLEALITALSGWASLGSRVAVATIPDRASLIARWFNGQMRSHTVDTKVVVVEIGSRARLGPRTTAPDRFHPNDNGYRPWLDGFGAITQRLPLTTAAAPN